MLETDLFGGKRDQFAVFVTNLVNNETATFYRGRKRYPVDGDCVRLLCFYAFVFFDACFNKKPILQEIGLFMDKEKDVAPLFQEACYWFEKWSGCSEEERCTLFCEKLNDLILKKAREVDDASYILLPDLRARREEIRRAVHPMSLDGHQYRKEI